MCFVGTGNKPNCCRLHYNYKYIRPTKFLSLLHTTQGRRNILTELHHEVLSYLHPSIPGSDTESERKIKKSQILDSELYFNCAPSSQQQNE